METSTVLVTLLLGGLLGLLGQGIRVVGGLKKLHDTTQEPLKENDQFDPRRLWITLFLGFIAGGLGSVSLMDAAGKINLNKDLVITLIGMGYAGVDFIESFLAKYISTAPKSTALPTTAEIAFENLPSWKKTSSFGVQNLSFEADEQPLDPRTIA